MSEPADTQTGGVQHRQATRDVAEACADALLSACALLVMLRGEEATPDEARDLAITTLDVVLDRSAREGAKPR
jgi:mannose/cellobiose epimerase-like protein (N-acyl-D-glucosamine 2-epimerase family)